MGYYEENFTLPMAFKVEFHKINGLKAIQFTIYDFEAFLCCGHVEEDICVIDVWRSSFFRELEKDKLLKEYVQGVWDREKKNIIPRHGIYLNA